MYIAKRVWLFNSGGKGEIFEFKTEKEEIAKKEQGWFESKAEAKKSISPEVKPITEAVTEAVVKEVMEKPEPEAENKEPDSANNAKEADGFDHEKYPIKFSDDKE